MAYAKLCGHPWSRSLSVAVIGCVDLVVGMLVGYNDLDVGMLNLVYPFLWRQMHFQSLVWVDTVCGCFHVTKQWYGYQSFGFIVHAVVTACDCILGCMNVVRESALK